MRNEKKIKFTPELLIEAPRPTPLVPNATGKLAFYTTSSYSIEDDKETQKIYIRDLAAGKTFLLSDHPDIKELQWLERNKLLWLRSIGGGKTQVWTGRADPDETRYAVDCTIDVPIWNVKVKVFNKDFVYLAFCALVDSDGGLFNAETAPKPSSTAREFDSIRTRFWDTWYSKERPSLWYMCLVKSNGSYQIAGNTAHNVLKGTRLEFPFVPSAGLGAGGSYEIRESGIVFDTIDLEKYDPAIRQTTDIWYFPFGGRNQKLHKVVVPGWDGPASGAKFAPDGKSVAFLKTKEWGVPAQLNSIFVARVDGSPAYADGDEVYLAESCAASWDRSPSSLHWSNDGKHLYAITEDCGRDALFDITIPFSFRDLHEAIPKPLPVPGSISAVHSLSSAEAETRLVVTSTTMVDSSIYILANPVRHESGLISSFTDHGADLGLSSNQVSEFNIHCSRDDEEYDIQSWIVVPSDFQKHKQYPVAFFIHGGPADSWSDSWSTRWNPAVFAEQGYVVIMPNISGSTGFGKKLAKGVVYSWGGRPYNDIVDCFNFVRDNLPYADTDRAVLLGASYGGYMANWIMGQPLAKDLKAIVSHDGIWSLASLQGTDFPAGLDKTFEGDDPELRDKFDPSRFTKNWRTPMLVIHSDRDFRCPLNAGLAAFNTCQMKKIPSRFLNFPDENHHVLKRANSLKWHYTVLGWINHWVENERGVKLLPAVSEP
ncbi:MAG: hypothetical protein Q9227_005142 [Pyrenula ochraceoflavens]